jgi:putative tRNA adenosine deaminase-associated protein
MAREDNGAGDDGYGYGDRDDAAADGGEPYAADVVDLAVLAYLEDGRWQAAPIPARCATRLPSLLAELRGQPSEGPVIGLVSIDEDFFLAARLDGDVPRLLLSDAGAAHEDPLAHAALLAIGDQLDDADLDDPRPAGDLTMFGDLGLPERELATLCRALLDVEDDDIYPEDVLGTIAMRLGFGEPFDRASRVAGV